jgi:hypothetical protein
MRVAEKTKWLLRLFKPEDSSGQETERVGFHSGSQDKSRVVHSVAKVLVCYAMALAVTVLLSRLH